MMDLRQFDVRLAMTRSIAAASVRARSGSVSVVSTVRVRSGPRPEPTNDVIVDTEQTRLDADAATDEHLAHSRIPASP